MWMEAREEKLEVMEKNQTMYKEVMDKRLMVWMEMIGEKVYGLDGSDGGKWIVWGYVINWNPIDKTSVLFGAKHIPGCIIL